MIGVWMTRRGDHLVVEHDGERPADILRRRLAEALRAADVEAEIDDRLVGALVEGRLRVGEIAALDDDAALDRHALAVRVLATAAGRRRPRPARASMPELELGGPAEDILQALRVLQAGHLDEDAVGALALDVRLGRAERVDAPAQHLDRLVDRPADPLVDARHR